jgi:malonyl-CoA/methylmalonyl-CoA synthetase
MTLPELFDRSLRGRRDAEAIEYAGPGGTPLRLRFGDLDARSDRLAALLLARGLRAGDRLAFLLENRVELIDLFLACVKAGIVVVPINVLYKEREITHILDDAQPSAVVASAALAEALPAGATRWPVEALAAEAAEQPASRPAASLGGDTPAAIVYTSGTTGASKGAVLTHGNFAANALVLLDCWRITSGDRYLATLPLFHVHGLGNGLHCWLASGCHMRLAERFDRTTAPSLFEEYRPTLFFGVPTMYWRLLELGRARAGEIGRAMRLFVSGSAPLAANVHEAFAAVFGHVILERYGMTEVLMILSNPYDGERRPGTVGLPLPGVEVRILDEQGNAVPSGETGELWVRGPSVFAGYWRRPDATAAAFRDGFFRTGDLGSRDRDGYVTLRGRRSDLIISGGFNVYPREVEELLLEQPGIREAAVVGAPDALRGEVPVAYVVADVPLDEAALRERLAGQIASFKLPRRYVAVDALPRNALGKVQKHLLRQR